MVIIFYIITITISTITTTNKSNLIFKIIGQEHASSTYTGK